MNIYAISLLYTKCNLWYTKVEQYATNVKGKQANRYTSKTTIHFKPYLKGIATPSLTSNVTFYEVTASLQILSRSTREKHLHILDTKIKLVRHTSRTKSKAPPPCWSRGWYCFYFRSGYSAVWKRQVLRISCTS